MRFNDPHVTGGEWLEEVLIEYASLHLYHFAVSELSFYEPKEN